MGYIKTFESFSPVNEEEENFFKKLMQGGTEIDMSSENFVFILVLSLLAIILFFRLFRKI